jgi:tRNA pseudouridine38-40 synthase
MIFRYKLIIEYDGSFFFGFQAQKTMSNLDTVQEALEKAIFLLTQQNVVIVGSGRTDSGVHALFQVVHFDLNHFFPANKLSDALNFHLKKLFDTSSPISVVKAELATNDFHARFKARSRTYCYLILNRRSPSPLFQKRAWHVQSFLDMQKMREASSSLLGSHDFSAFRSVHCQAKTAFRTMSAIEIGRENFFSEIFIVFRITAPSFLHNQARIIIGTLKRIGEGKMDMETIKKALDSGKRSDAGPTAPAFGLYFLNTEY